MKQIVVLFFTFFYCTIQALPAISNNKFQNNKPGVDLIIFTFDRPLQFDALIRSIKHYVKGIGTIYVLMRASSTEFTNAYQQIAAENPELIWLHQGESKKNNFKALLEHVLQKSQAEYLMFSVDDSIVKDYVDLLYCAEHIKKQQAYGFYLRLGTHLTQCHPKKCLQKVPQYKQVANDIILWNLRDGEYDWNYPGMLDMALYPAGIKQLFKKLKYTCPNSFETAWNSYVGFNNYKGLCFEHSKIVTIPINRVQRYGYTPSMELYTPQELLALYTQNYVIDFKKLHKINNRAGHIDWEPEFTNRECQSCDY